MTDECGYPTESGDGPPCQNRAGENGRCWIPSHNPDGGENPNGQPSKYTEDRAQEAIDAARDGFSKSGCARAAGVSPPTLLNWLDEDHTVDGEDFFNAFMRARHAGERRLVTGPLVESDHPGAPEVDGQHARFLLSTSFDYVKTERTELTGEDGGPVEGSLFDLPDEVTDNWERTDGDE